MGPEADRAVAVQAEGKVQERIALSLLPPHVHKGRAMCGHRESGRAQAGQWAFTREHVCQHLDLRLLASRTVRKKLLFELPCLRALL